MKVALCFPYLWWGQRNNYSVVKGTRYYIVSFQDTLLIVKVTNIVVAAFVPDK